MQCDHGGRDGRAATMSHGGGFWREEAMSHGMQAATGIEMRHRMDPPLEPLGRLLPLILDFRPQNCIN